MQKVMAASAPEPQLLGAAEVKKLTASNNAPIPNELLLDGRTVPISDLVNSIDDFRHQRKMLESARRLWPCVRVMRRAQNSASGNYLVPLDLGTQANPKGDSAEVSSGRAGERAAKEALAAGFQVQEVLPAQADKTFADMLGELLGKRAIANIGGNNEPPRNPFEVTTDSGRVEIVYSVGYFVSTKRGFGFSTPARRELHWGSYLFGTTKGGSVQFSDTLWIVPDVHSIHLPV